MTQDRWRRRSAFGLLMAGQIDWGQYIERSEMEGRAAAELAVERAAVGLDEGMSGLVDSLTAERLCKEQGSQLEPGRTAAPPERRCERELCDIRLVWSGFHVPLSEHCVVCGDVFHELVEDRRFAGSVAA